MQLACIIFFIVLKLSTKSFTFPAYTDYMNVPMQFEVRYLTEHADLPFIEADETDTVSFFKESILCGLQGLQIIEPDEIRIQAVWKNDVTAPGGTNIGKFLKHNGKIIVRGASTATASKLSNIGGLTTMEKRLNIYRSGRNNLALRSLVDSARTKVWNDALKLPGIDTAMLLKWRCENKVYGQSEESWKLKLKSLDAHYPDWKTLLKLDVKVYDTLHMDEYRKVFCTEAHEFTDEDINLAVRDVQPGLKGFYGNVLTFVKGVNIEGSDHR